MKKIIYLLFISSIQMFGQGVLAQLEMATEKASQKLGFYYHDGVCDTLLVDSKMMFFKKSPITNLKGYTKVFNSEEIFIILYPFTPGGKGYFINWVIKNNRLYIQHITLQENRGKFKRTEEGTIIEIKYNKLKESQIKKRIEQFTGKKFNKHGLLPAKWVSGELGALALNPYNRKVKNKKAYKQFLKKNQEHYKMIFKKGKLKEMLLVKGKTIIK